MSVHIVLLTLTLLSLFYDEQHLCYEDSASDGISKVFCCFK